MSTSSLTHTLQGDSLSVLCAVCFFLTRTPRVSLDGLVETAWSLKLASPFIGKRIKQKVSILPLPNLPQQAVQSQTRCLATQQATEGTGFCKESGGCSSERRDSWHQGSKGSGSLRLQGLGWPLSLSQHGLLLSHVRALASRETGPFSSRKLLMVAGVSCLVLAPPAR